MAAPGGGPEADVNYVIDEKASRIKLEDNQTIAPARPGEPAIASTGPTNWWRTALLALAGLALVIVLLQVLGGPASTDVVPGTPVSSPTAPASTP